MPAFTEHEAFPAQPLDRPVLPIAAAAPAPTFKKEFRLERQGAGYTCETIAMKAMAGNEIGKALDILLIGILIDTLRAFRRGGSPNYRLYDLFAGLAHRAGIAPQLKPKLVAYINMYWRGDPRLARVAQRMSHPTQKWALRWKAPILKWMNPSPPKKKSVERQRKRRLSRKGKSG